MVAMATEAVEELAEEATEATEAGVVAADLAEVAAEAARLFTSARGRFKIRKQNAKTHRENGDKHDALVAVSTSCATATNTGSSYRSAATAAELACT